MPLADAQWLQALAAAGDREDAPKAVLAAARLLRDLRLASRTGLQEAVFAAAAVVFEREDPGVDGVRVAHLTARGDLQVPDEFRYLCRDGRWRSASEGLMVDPDGALLDTGAEWAQRRIVADTYSAVGGPREQQAWARWAGGSRSRLRRFLIPTETPVERYGKKAFEQLVSERGGHAPESYPLKGNRFEGTDYDFPGDVWDGWTEAAREDDGVWAAVCRGIINDWDAEWERRSRMSVMQLGSRSRRPRALDHGTLATAWVNRLRGLPCLPDTRGRMRVPAELFRTNARTAHLVDVEPFLAEAFDTEAAGLLLDLLGVRDTPDSADRLLNRLRALSGTAAPAAAVHGLYVALDRSVRHLGDDALEAVQTAFAEEALVRSGEGTWHRAIEVVQRNDEGIPGLAALPDDLVGLALWDRVGVSRQPSTEGILEWLRSLPTGVPMRFDQSQRVRSVLPRLPQRVWEEVGAWLDAVGAWTPTAAFEYSAADGASFLWLFEGFRRSVADLSMLPESLRTQSPFASVRPLDGAIEYRVATVDAVGQAEPRGWLTALAEGLARAEPAPGVAAEVAARRRREAGRLARTQWQRVRRVEAEPTVDGRPVGPRKAAEVLWADETLYAVGEGPQVHGALVRALSGPFEEAPVRRAVEACVGRTTEWVRDYLDATFVLNAAVPIPSAPMRPDTREATPSAPDLTPEASPESMSDPVPADADPPEGDDGRDTTDSKEHAPETPEAEPPTLDEEPVAGEPTAPTRRTRSEGPPSELAAYWGRCGYRVDSARAFVHPDGRRVEREPGVFPLVERGASWSALGRYWVSRQSLAVGVDLPAEVWDLLRQGEDYALLIPNAQGRLERYGWDRLEPCLDAGTVTLHAAGYRLLQPDTAET